MTFAEQIDSLTEHYFAMENVCLKYKIKTIVILFMFPPESTSFYCRRSSPASSPSLSFSLSLSSPTILFVRSINYLFCCHFKENYLSCFFFLCRPYFCCKKMMFTFSANYQYLCPLELCTLRCIHTTVLQLWTFTTIIINPTTTHLAHRWWRPRYAEYRWTLAAEITKCRSAFFISVIFSLLWSLFVVDAFFPFCFHFCCFAHHWK